MLTPKDDEGATGASGRRVTKITLTCPTCRASKCITLDQVVNEFGSGGIVNMFVPPATTPCEHPFGIYLDSNMKIRGYNKIDCILDERKEELMAGPVVSAPGPEMVNVEVMQPREIRLKDESELTTRDSELKEELDMLMVKLAQKVPEIEAIAVFDYEGYILTKLLPDSITIDEVAILASSLMTQSMMMGKALRLKELEDFTLTSSGYKVMVKKAGDMLVMLYYDKNVRKGLMDLHVSNLATAIEEILVASANI
ncbi:MAG: roadblock/LC7 domain-containing protein [Candidatus Hodarchaeota archaeon]